MKNIAEINSLKDLIRGSSKVLLVTRERPSVDGLASMLALAQTLLQNNKIVSLACSGEIPESARELPGIEKISSELQATNLIISFDYVEGMVEKVSYNIDGDRFNLILTGKDSVIDPNKINFSNSGVDFDLIILMDTPKLEYLGKLLEHDEDIYSKIPTLNIDHHSSNLGFGSYNWINDKESSTSELVFDIITSLELVMTKESAELILAGIKSATNNFEKSLNAETLERAAACMRALGQVEDKEESTPAAPDESWFAPKIYRSSKIIE